MNTLRHTCFFCAFFISMHSKANENAAFPKPRTTYEMKENGERIQDIYQRYKCSEVNGVVEVPINLFLEVCTQQVTKRNQQ